MTIDFAAPPRTEALISDKRPAFFPVSIPSQHQQLKNLISSKHEDYLYYAANYGVYSLHIPTNRRKLVKGLKFQPTCLDAAFSWIAVGGYSRGQCAFIHVSTERMLPSSASSLRQAEVDELIPLDLDPESRALLRQDSPSHPMPSALTRHYTLYEHNIGDEIVNSVVIQRLPRGRPGLDDEIVAILTNNDRSVRFFSLSKLNHIPSPESYPVSMNHATISPDGNLLLAVGDARQAFLSRRQFLYGSDGKAIAYQWHSLCELTLTLAQRDDTCFTTAWSPSGHVCAAASQTGVISIYDTSLLKVGISAEEATVASLKSSRLNVNSYRAAIRSMSFSPEPFDLLAFGEDQGRVTVIDLRNALQSVQVLNLNTKSPQISRVDIQDFESASEQRQLEIERRFLESHGEALSLRDQLAAVTNATDYMESVAERRRIERESELTALRSDPHRLSDSERRTISAIGLRRAARAAHPDPPTPISVNYSSAGNARLMPPGSALDDTSLSTGPSRQTASIAEYMRLRNFDRPRASGDPSSRPPRRRNSVVIPNSNRSHLYAPHSSNLTSTNGVLDALSTSPSQLPSSSTTTETPTAPTDDPWQTISAVMGMNNDVLARMRRLDSETTNYQNSQRHYNNDSSSDLSVRAQQTAQRMAQLQHLANRNEEYRRFNLPNVQRLNMVRRAQARQSNSDDEEGIVLGDWSSHRNSEDGVVTMGVSWSPNGRNLYVGTEEGIFEYKVNELRRRLFPGYELL